MSDEESPADRDERVMLSHHIDEMHMDDMKDRIVELEAENKRLRAALVKAALEHRVIAGMDLMGASSTAYNAAREAETALEEKE